MTQLEKIIEEIQHSNTPTKQFLEFVERDKEYQKAKTDKDKWKVILMISQRFSDIFKNGEYEDLRTIFKARYPNL
ncbi:hypothetical protein SOM12_04700 [Flavobacterium sp. CFBP9031]|jgi:hypothetical protein|uniref:hypothetical protein n=1 Tax=Flavobacterium sp. CFBP9031 TaxID=3096538 RepID=UPI002A6A191B|nr:hypothetical protein [Flavobacterium sp. CFBP9031]MDY0986704.1 hypothetical protein [Flavobacterium sp. CFBP9031]